MFVLQSGRLAHTSYTYQLCHICRKTAFLVLQAVCFFACDFVIFKGILNIYEFKSFAFFFYFFDCFGALKFLTKLRLEKLFQLVVGQDILIQVIILAKRINTALKTVPLRSHIVKWKWWECWQKWPLCLRIYDRVEKVWHSSFMF